MDSLKFPEQNNPNFKDRGLGDTIDRFTQATGIKWLVMTITQKLGVSCGCKKRRELLNKWFPYKKNKKMNKHITLEEILDPISPELFWRKYWNKRHLIIRRNKFKDLYTWKDFNKYLNQFPGIKGLQIINCFKGGAKYCHDKVKRKVKGYQKMPILTKQQVYDQWRAGKTFVLPLAEYQKKDLVDICFTFEKYFGSGCANMYCSPKAGSKSFNAHADSTENFLFHTEGRTKWKMYKEFAPGKPKEILEEFVLEAGDLLYIPQFQFHEVETIGPRILISIHFHNKDRQSLRNFKVTTYKENKRKKWYDWTPKNVDPVKSGREKQNHFPLRKTNW